MQGGYVRKVKVEQKVCTPCRLQVWAGDDIYEDGVFNYNGRLMIELRVLYQLRVAFHTGTPISSWVGNFLGRRMYDLDWLDKPIELAAR